MEKKHLSNPESMRNWPQSSQSAMQQVFASFLHLKKPDETAFEKALFVASSSSTGVCELFAHLLKQYPRIQFQVLTDERNSDALKERFHTANIRVFPLSINRQEKQSLISMLRQERYDICFLLFSGESHYDFIKLAGLLSGARYIKAYPDLGAPFYVTITKPWKLLRHLIVQAWNRPIENRWNIFGFLGILLGYFVALAHVRPLLATAKRTKDLPNPFLES